MRAFIYISGASLAGMCSYFVIEAIGPAGIFLAVPIGISFGFMSVVIADVLE